MRKGSPKIAVAYIRVSTDDQRLGMEAQRASIEAWAVREGVQVASWHVDEGISGATPLSSRKALVEALEALREHKAGFLVAAKRDRVARDVVIAVLVERAAASGGAQLVSADGTGNGDQPADAFMRTVIDGAAAYERALIRARTKAALASKRAKGERTGGIPYGQSVDDDGIHLVPVHTEQAIIALIQQLRGSGLTLRAVTAELEAQGHVSRAGRPFVLNQVVRVLARAA